MLACALTIQMFGAARLAIYLGGDFGLAFRLGVMPFIWIDLLKVAVAAAIVIGTSSLTPKGSTGTV
jgi:biotin transporter BioY